MNKTSISKYISKILRHQPSIIGITLDDEGYADVNELIDGIGISQQLLEEIVKEDQKQRYSFNKDHTKIKANQGHSIDVNVHLTKSLPPDILYHGTCTRFIDLINQEGIKSMSRQYVHLSKDIETAKMVGSRHGKVVVLEINTKAMINDGYEFYLSDNAVWLTKYIPTKYIRTIG